MRYKLVTGLYVANYICLAPELLMTLKALKERSTEYCDMINEAVGRVLVAQTQYAHDLKRHNFERFFLQALV